MPKLNVKIKVNKEDDAVELKLKTFRQFIDKVVDSEVKLMTPRFIVS